MFPFPGIKTAIEKKTPCVLNEHDKSVKLEDLLYFEPYSQLSTDEKKSKKIRIYKERIEQLSIFRGRKPPQGILFVYLTILFSILVIALSICSGINHSKIIINVIILLL